MTAPSGPARPRLGTAIGALVAVLAVALLVFLTVRRPTGDPFDVRSSAPDGYRALSLLLADHGADVVGSSAAAAAAAVPGPDQVIVVPAPGLASSDELDSFRDVASGGSTVVFGSAVDGGRSFGIEGWDDRSLAETPAQAASPGECTIAEFDGLGSIDNAFAPPDDLGTDDTCYGSRGSSVVGSEDVGDGRIVTLSSPYLLVNARLQPDKENGGQPLDNASVALRLFGPAGAGAGEGVTVTVVDAVPSVDPVDGGRESLLDLVPLPVKLALAQGVVAFVLLAWWRSRRLGRPVQERLPVEIAGSELVVAVGDLLRRQGSPDRAAAVMRAEVRRELGRRLGIPPGAPTTTLVGAVASRTGRPPDDIAAVLVDRPCRSADELVRLAQSIDSIRQEVLHDPVPV